MLALVCCRLCTFKLSGNFIEWVDTQIREHKWSLEPDRFFIYAPRCFFIFSAFPDVRHWIDIGIFVEKTEPSGKPEGFFSRARPAVFSFFQKGSGA